ncbi:MAG TPA: glycoside hydrolase family 27 protein [Terriglobia bacterium]|nr:glycoside hydrolase family 27 protein [Terriglobia bacterium]
MKKLILLFPLLFFFTLAPASALDNGLAKTLPMGWNSWNKFGCNVSEKLIKEMADAMVSTGMKAAGYQYIVIDDCWQVSRDANGNIVPDPERFPSGMKALADYVHSKGLKFGLYSDAGTGTCQNRPGSRGYEFQDARQYAAWGVDYLKYDWCNHSTQNVQASYAIMRDALKASGRPIVFSMCEWGVDDPWKWAADIGNLWRTTGDITDCWSCTGVYTRGVMQIVDQEADLWPYAGPGHWNDPDMLEVGNPGLSIEESRSHFSLWSMLAAPLIAGNDLRHMSPQIREILTNKEVIAVDQDPLGHQGQRYRDYGDTEVWRKELTGNTEAYLLLNRSETPKEISVYVGENVRVRDLWKHEDLGPFADGFFRARVVPHGVVMIKVLPK